MLNNDDDNPFREPSRFNPHAFHHLQENWGRIHTTDGLLQCALAVSMHALEDVKSQEVDAEINNLVAKVREQCRGNDPRALVAHLHDVLFEKEGFHGCDANHYNYPSSSYVSVVLKTKQGLPIALALIYKLVAERLGLQVQGILSRGHFLARVYDGLAWMIVDPFQQGRILSVEEACNLIGALLEEGLEPNVVHLPIASNPAWLKRIVVNVAFAFDRMSCTYDLQAMNELLRFLPSE